MSKGIGHDTPRSAAMQMEHNMYTPGPYTVYDDGGPSLSTVDPTLQYGEHFSDCVWAGGKIVADCSPNGLRATDETRATARLFAAAPDLLEACRQAEIHFGPFADITINGQHDPEDMRVVALMRATIAKALGTA